MGTASGPDGKPLIDVWTGPPQKRGRVGGMNGTRLASLCAVGFRRVTGLTLHPGETKQVRFSLEVLD